MKTSSSLNIAIPGENRNAKIVKNIFLRKKIINENDLSQEIILSSKLPIRFIQMRVQDALTYLGTSGEKGNTKIDGAILGFDQIRENVDIPEQRQDGEITGYATYPEEGGRYPIYDIPFVFDGEEPANLTVLVKEEDRECFPDLKSIVTRSGGAIISPYPNLVKSIMEERFNDSRFVRKVFGKTEALVRGGIARFAIDIVDTGKTAKRNKLLPTETIFQSYPAGLFLSEQLAEDPLLQSAVTTLTEISNEEYYNSWKYREKYPRG